MELDPCYRVTFTTPESWSVTREGAGWDQESEENRRVVAANSQGRKMLRIALDRAFSSC